MKPLFRGMKMKNIKTKEGEATFRCNVDAAYEFLTIASDTFTAHGRIEFVSSGVKLNTFETEFFHISFKSDERALTVYVWERDDSMLERNVWYNFDESKDGAKRLCAREFKRETYCFGIKVLCVSNRFTVIRE